MTKVRFTKGLQILIGILLSVIGLSALIIPHITNVILYWSVIGINYIFIGVFALSLADKFMPSDIEGQFPLLALPFWPIMFAILILMGIAMMLRSILHLLSEAWDGLFKITRNMIDNDF